MWVHCRGASDRSLSKAKGHSILFEVGRVGNDHRVWLGNQGAKGKVIPMHATAHAFPKSQAGAAPKRWRHG